VYERNGQGQVVALKRSKVRTSWLQGLETPQVIVKDLPRTLHIAPVKAMTALREDKPWKEQVSVATFSAM
jgi:hypothetical protein